MLEQRQTVLKMIGMAQKEQHMKTSEFGHWCDRLQLLRPLVTSSSATALLLQRDESKVASST